MLRIKDDVELNELRKYGLEIRESYDVEHFKEIELEGEDFDGWVEIIGFHKWRGTYYSDCFDLEELYDLIQAGLVEKDGE